MMRYANARFVVLARYIWYGDDGSRCMRNATDKLKQKIMAKVGFLQYKYAKMHSDSKHSELSFVGSNI